MSANPRWCFACSITIALTFFPVFSKGLAEDQNQKTLRPFQTQEEVNRFIDDQNKLMTEIWKPFLSEEDLKKLIDDEIRIIKQGLKKNGDPRKIDAGKIRRAALLMSLAAVNWKDPKNPRQPFAVSAAAAALGKEGSWKTLEQRADRLANFKEIDERSLYRDWKKINWDRIMQSAVALRREQFPAAMMRIFSDFNPRDEQIERELLGLDSRPRALQGTEMSEKVQLMAFKSALIARVTKTYPKLISDKSYSKWADDMDEASLELAAAIKAKKEAAANKALQKLTRSCISCHEALLGRPNVQELITSLKSKDFEDRQKAADRLADYGFAADKPEYRAVMPREEGSVDHFRQRLKPGHAAFN